MDSRLIRSSAFSVFLYRSHDIRLLSGAELIGDQVYRRVSGGHFAGHSHHYSPGVKEVKKTVKCLLLEVEPFREETLSHTSDIQ